MLFGRIGKRYMTMSGAAVDCTETRQPSLKVCRAAATGAGVAVGMCVVASAAFAQVAPSAAPPTDAEILGIVQKHCVQCHAVEPTHPAFAKPPAGIVLETIAAVAQYAPRILTQVAETRAMPLGNETDMTDEERNRLAAWIEGRK
jgi:uncharacterized membrane protein